MNLELINKKSTDTEHAHTEVWQNDVYLGYIIKNNSTLSVVDENWNFVSKSHLLSMFDRTKDLLIKKIQAHAAI